MINYKQRWNRLQNANRKPEVELQNAITEHARIYAQSKRDRRIEEGHLWTVLFENTRMLRQSLARFPRRDVISGAVRLDRSWFSPPPELLPSEHTRQFLNFKVVTSLRLFGQNAPRRPRYADLYSRQRAPGERNAQNVAHLMERCRTETDLQARRQSMFDQTTSILQGRVSAGGECKSPRMGANTLGSGLRGDTREGSMDTVCLPRIPRRDVTRVSASKTDRAVHFKDSTSVN